MNAAIFVTEVDYFAWAEQRIAARIFHADPGDAGFDADVGQQFRRTSSEFLWIAVSAVAGLCPGWRRAGLYQPA